MEEFIVELSEENLSMLDALVDDGTYGKTREEVLAWLIKVAANGREDG